MADRGRGGCVCGSEHATYSNADIDKEVGPNEAVPDLSRLIGNRFLGQSNGAIDKEGLTEVERGEARPWWDGLQAYPLDDSKGCRKEGIWGIGCFGN